MAEEYQSKRDKAIQKKAKESAHGAVNPLEKQARGIQMDQTAYQAPEFTRHPASVTVKAGARIRLFVSCSGVPTPQVRWRHNGSLVDGANGNMLVIPNARASHAGTYTAEAYNIAGIVTSRMVTVTVKAKDAEKDASVSLTPEQIEVVHGTEFAFLAQLKNCDGLKVTYQWYKDGKRIKDATSPILRISSAKQKYVGTYHVKVGTPEGPIESNRGKLVLKSLPLPVAPGKTDAADSPVSAADPVVAEDFFLAEDASLTEDTATKPAISGRDKILRKKRRVLEQMLEKTARTMTKPSARVYGFDKTKKTTRKAG